MRWVLIALIILTLGLIPNVYWLWGSSVILRNQSDGALPVRLSLTDDPDQLIEFGAIDPGAGHFQWVHVSGEATLEVDVFDGDVWRRHCREYIEQATYRVEIVIRSPREVTCKTSLPVFHHVLLLDYLS